MINLRYHIVSIVAVFLALGIGIAMGTSFIDGVIVDRLERSVETLEVEREADERQIASLTNRLAEQQEAVEEFERAAVSSIHSRRLDGVPVMVIAAEGVDSSDLVGLRLALVGSGAVYEGVLRLSSRLDPEVPAGRDDLAAVLDLDSEDPDTLTAALAERWRDALLPVPLAPVSEVTGRRTAGVVEAFLVDPQDPALPAPPDSGAPDDTLLVDLVAAGLAEYDTVGVARADLSRLPRRGSRYLVVSGPEAVDGTGAVLREVVLTLLRAEPAPVVVGVTSRSEAETSFLDTFRGDGALGDTVSTVDAVATYEGVSAAVMALDRLDELPVGDYGRDSDADALLPVR